MLDGFTVKPYVDINYFKIWWKYSGERDGKFLLDFVCIIIEKNNEETVDSKVY